MKKCLTSVTFAAKLPRVRVADANFHQFTLTKGDRSWQQMQTVNDKNQTSCLVLDRSRAARFRLSIPFPLPLLLSLLKTRTISCLTIKGKFISFIHKTSWHLSARLERPTYFAWLPAGRAIEFAGSQRAALTQIELPRGRRGSQHYFSNVSRLESWLGCCLCAQPICEHPKLWSKTDESKTVSESFRSGSPMRPSPSLLSLFFLSFLFFFSPLLFPSLSFPH